MTGEGNLIRKSVLEPGNEDKSAPFLVSGTQVMGGTGQMVVLAVGTNSMLGKMKLLMQDETPPTPLQLKLATVADDIGDIGLRAAIFTFGCMLIHYLIEIFFDTTVRPFVHLVFVPL